LQIATAMNSCGVPGRFLTADRSDINPKIWSQVSGFLQGESLFIFGFPGVGKTHIACALMKDMISSEKAKAWAALDQRQEIYFPKLPRMISVPELLLRIRECFSGRIEESESSLIKYFSEKPFLILDDLGAEKTTEWSLQTLYTIIDRRYRDVRQTMITSNLTLDEIAEKVGDRIASRIAGMCKVVEIKGKDRRLKN
jgi:DNA replication protein DnaC